MFGSFIIIFFCIEQTDTIMTLNSFVFAKDDISVILISFFQIEALFIWLLFQKILELYANCFDF